MAKSRSDASQRRHLHSDANDGAADLCGFYRVD